MSELISISAERLRKGEQQFRKQLSDKVPEHPSEQLEVPLLSLCSSAGVASYRGVSGCIYPGPMLASLLFRQR